MGTSPRWGSGSGHREFVEGGTGVCTVCRAPVTRGGGVTCSSGIDKGRVACVLYTIKWGHREYAHAYYNEFFAPKRRYVRAVAATLPMSQTTEEGATGSVRQAPVELAGAALLASSQETQHGAPRATERRTAEEAKLLDTLL